VGGAEFGESGGHESMRGVFRGCQSIYIYRYIYIYIYIYMYIDIYIYISIKSRVIRTQAAADNSPLCLTPQQRVTRNVTRAGEESAIERAREREGEAIDHLLSATLTLLGATNKDNETKAYYLYDI